MHPIFHAEGNTFYAPKAKSTSLTAERCASSKAALQKLQTLLQVFLDASLDAAIMSAPGLHTYANTLDGGYLVLAVTDRGATVYSASLEDLVFRNLPLPRPLSTSPYLATGKHKGLDQESGQPC